jgi:tellurite resistance protein TehA-like permease
MLEIFSQSFNIFSSCSLLIFIYLALIFLLLFLFLLSTSLYIPMTKTATTGGLILHVAIGTLAMTQVSFCDQLAIGRNKGSKTMKLTDRFDSCPEALISTAILSALAEVSRDSPLVRLG